MDKKGGLANPWLIFTIGAMSHYAVMFNRTAVGQMFPQLMAEFNTTGVGLAALSSIYYYTYAIMQVPAGSLADTLGPRKLMSFGMFLGALGWFIFASAQSLAVASMARLISGFGLAGIFLGLLKSISIWFPAKRFGTLTGLSTFFGNLGVATAMFPFVLLVGAIGWRGASYTVAWVTLTIAVLIWLLVKDEGPYGVGPEEGGLRIHNEDDFQRHCRGVHYKGLVAALLRLPSDIRRAYDVHRALGSAFPDASARDTPVRCRIATCDHHGGRGDGCHVRRMAHRQERKA